MSLLDKAQAVTPRTVKRVTFTEEEKELVMAFVNDKITMKQLSVAKGYKSSGACVSFVFNCMRQLLRTKK